MKLKQMRHNESTCLSALRNSISTNMCGLLSCRTEQDIANFISTLVFQFPEARCLFAYRSWSQIETIRGYLPLEVARLVPTRQQLANHGVWYKRHLVPVSKLENCNPDDWDVIVTDADMALFRNRIESVQRVKQQKPSCRIYATYDPDRKRSQDEWMKQEEIFGPCLNGYSHIQPSIEVHWVDPGAVTIPKYANPVQRTSQGYWHAPERLQAIKSHVDSVLKSVEVRKLATPQESTHGLVDGREIIHQSDGTLQVHGVVILVDTPEHGRAVQTVWPDWPLEAKCHSSSIAGVLSPRCIATVSAADSGLIPPGDVVVLAGRSTPRIYCRMLESYASTRLAPVQLIIPADRFDDTAIRESQNRYRQLAERRWRQHAATAWLHNS